MPATEYPSLAEQRATREGLPVVAVALYELLSAMQGQPIVVSTLDGNEVLLRLLTVDEALAQQHAAVDRMPEGHRPRKITRERAADLVRPLGDAS